MQIYNDQSSSSDDRSKIIEIELQTDRKKRRYLHQCLLDPSVALPVGSDWAVVRDKVKKKKDNT